MAKGHRSIYAVIAALVFASSVHSFQRPDPLRAAPEIYRARLELRLSEFVSHHRTKNWAQVHAMLSEQFRKTLGGDASLDRFIDERRYSRLKRFTPMRSTELSGAPDPPLVIVIGCGELERLGPNLNEEADVECTWENEDWYFTEIRSHLPCLDCQPRGCKH